MEMTYWIWQSLQDPFFSLTAIICYESYIDLLGNAFHFKIAYEMKCAWFIYEEGRLARLGPFSLTESYEK